MRHERSALLLGIRVRVHGVAPVTLPAHQMAVAAIGRDIESVARQLRHVIAEADQNYHKSEQVARRGHLEVQGSLIANANCRSSRLSSAPTCSSGSRRSNSLRTKSAVAMIAFK